MDVPPPVDLTDMVSDNSATISWKSSSDIFSFFVEIFESATSDDAIIQNTTHETSVTFQSLSPGQEYIVVVKTVVSGSCRSSNATMKKFRIPGIIL